MPDLMARVQPRALRPNDRILRTARVLFLRDRIPPGRPWPVSVNVSSITPGTSIRSMTASVIAWRPVSEVVAPVGVRPRGPGPLGQASQRIFLGG